MALKVRLNQLRSGLPARLKSGVKGTDSAQLCKLRMQRASEMNMPLNWCVLIGGLLGSETSRTPSVLAGSPARLHEGFTLNTW